MNKATMAAGISLLLVGSGSALADTPEFVKVDFSEFHNFKLQDLHSPYPQGMNITLGDVPFGIPKNVPANMWISDPTMTVVGDIMVEIPTGGIMGVDGVHMLMNTIIGDASENSRVAVQFVSFGDDSPVSSQSPLVFTRDLFGNDDIRSYINSGGTGTDFINGVTTEQVFISGNQQIRLDKIFIDLPNSFNGRSLDMIRVIDTGAPLESRAFVAGITAQIIPAPGSAALLGLGGLFAARRRR